MARPIALAVDDRQNMVRLVEKVLRKDFDVRTAESGAAAVAILEKEPVAVVVCDLRMPDMDGLDVLRASKRLRPNAEFVLMTAYASVPTAVEALRAGAYDYITKPFEPEDLRAVVMRALGRSSTASAAEPTPSTAALVDAEPLPGLVGRSAVMHQLAALVRKIATSDATVLVLGETGTGKERISRALHTLGPRAAQRFVPVNCSAIPADLLESELFGHARGAFTGAARDRAGLFEEADRGTLFLDEIGEMRLSLQAKLTRAVEERSIRRLGESRERAVDVRLVAATHRDLEAMVRADAFREDLWYRLNVAVVRIPPLRDRREDIPLLAMHFLRERAATLPERRVIGFTDEALEALAVPDWPGNVRQLRAVVERASIVAASERIDVADLPHEVLTSDRGRPASGELGALPWQEAMEVGRRDSARRYLQAVLRRFDGRVAEAAAHAQIERESFYRLLRKHGVRPDGSLGDPED